jgi:AcrR family transcriptional regulator
MSSSALTGTKGVPRREREDQIVAEAVGEFAARGYARASMVDIAQRASISKPLIYQYFGSKDGLYLACLHHVADGLVGRLEQAELAVDESVASRIHPLRAVFEALEPQREAWRLLFDRSAPISGAIPQAAARYQARTAELAASGSARFLQARGVTDSRDASALSTVWMGVVNSLVEWWLARPDESADAMVERCERLLAAITG